MRFATQIEVWDKEDAAVCWMVDGRLTLNATALIAREACLQPATWEAFVDCHGARLQRGMGADCGQGRLQQRSDAARQVGLLRRVGLAQRPRHVRLQRLQRRGAPPHLHRQLGLAARLRVKTKGALRLGVHPRSALSKSLAWSVCFRTITYHATPQVLASGPGKCHIEGATPHIT